jgi:hypothetical protein
VLGERRQRPERRVLTDDEVTDPPVLERRRGADRRQPTSGAYRRGTRVLPMQWQDGWLVFEADRSPDVRRLAPIPPDWEDCKDDVLAAYLAGAHASERRTA